jgi:hypothetical protein
MRPDPDTCRDPDLLAAEVRRLRGVIAAGEPALTDAEREAFGVAISLMAGTVSPQVIGTMRGALERLG